MKLFKRISLLTGLLALCWSPLAAALQIVATTPDLGSIAEEIGGDRVSVISLARGAEDTHFVDARPSYIRHLNRADVLIEGGAELEAGWLPSLLQNARNRPILPGNEGHIDASRGIRMLNVPEGPVDRRMGDVHISGNPHYLLDPRNGILVAESVAERLAALDPENEEVYSANLERFRERIEEKLDEWTAALEAYRGTQVVTYHPTFDYLAERFGFEVVDTVEPLPGIEPSPRHIRELVSRMEDREIAMIWKETFRPRRTAQRVADQSNVPLLVLPDKPGAVEGTDDYPAVFDVIVTRIVETMEGSG